MLGGPRTRLSWSFVLLSPGPPIPLSRPVLSHTTPTSHHDYLNLNELKWNKRKSSSSDQPHYNHQGDTGGRWLPYGTVRIFQHREFSGTAHFSRLRFPWGAYGPCRPLGPPQTPCSGICKASALPRLFEGPSLKGS